MAPSITNRRNCTLELLASLGIELPKQTKFPDDELKRRLGRAIKAAQNISTAIPNPPLVPSSLPRWTPHPSTADHLASLMRRHNLQEMVDISIAREQGKLNAVELYVDPLHDVRQTLMSFALTWSKGYSCCMVQDRDKQVWAILIRVSLPHFASEKLSF